MCSFLALIFYSFSKWLYYSIPFFFSLLSFIFTFRSKCSSPIPFTKCILNPSKTDKNDFSCFSITTVFERIFLYCFLLSFCTCFFIWSLEMYKLYIKNAKELVVITKNHEKMLIGKDMDHVEVMNNRYVPLPPTVLLRYQQFRKIFLEFIFSFYSFWKLIFSQ